MIEAKLLIGRHLQLTPAPPRALTGNPPAFVNVVCPPMTITESNRMNPGAMLNPFRNVGGVRQSTAIQGTNANKVHVILDGFRGTKVTSLKRPSIATC